jgi:hypothetical protein
MLAYSTLDQMLCPLNPLFSDRDDSFNMMTHDDTTHLLRWASHSARALVS